MVIGSIYGKNSVNESFTDPIQPSQSEKEVMKMRNSMSEAARNGNASSRNDIKPVKSLSSFKKVKPMSLNQSMDLQSAEDPRHNSQISFHDFLPNSITRSPSRANISHSQTSMRLGLLTNKAANRREALSIMEDMQNEY